MPTRSSLCALTPRRSADSSQRSSPTARPSRSARGPSRYVLLSDADREALYEKLKRHAAEGRLSVEELERRVAVVAMAEDQETAAAAVSDLAPLAGTAPETRPDGRR